MSRVYHRVEVDARSAEKVLFTISIPGDSRTPFVQKMLQQCLESFPSQDIEIVVGANSPSGVPGENFLTYDSQQEYRRHNLMRQREGINEAKERGVQFGRKELTKPKNFAVVMKKWRGKEISANRVAKLLGVSRPTFIKWTKEKRRD
jgi:hypothetical protein